MAQKLQMNITKSDKILRYLIDVDDTRDTTHGVYGSYDVQGINGLIQFFNQTGELNNVIRDMNIWTIENQIHDNYYIPRAVKQKKIRLYIPVYSIESFYDNTFVDGIDLSGLRYIISAYTYINGQQVVLGNYIFSALDTVAAPKIFNYKGNEYHSMIEFSIIDPAVLVYSDEWAGFREEMCGEPAGTNNTGSVLNFDLHVVTKTENGWIESVDFKGCSSGMTFNRYQNESMVASLSFDNGAILKLLFNDEYENDLWTYMSETYGIEGGCVLAYELIVRDQENVYLAPPVVMDSIDEPYENRWFIDTNSGDLIINAQGDTNRYRHKLVVYNERVHTNIPKPPTHTFTRSELIECGANNWGWYKDGLILQGCIYIFRPEVPREDFEALMEYETPIMEFVSNEIPITKEIFKFLLPLENSLGIEKINLAHIDMQEYNVHVVNKIQKEVISINRPDDYKANIIKPVFIRSVDQKNITVHPQVTENLSFNLNRYKSTVDIFYIRLEGIDFIETGRTDSTVIFRIDGSRLPNEVTEGKYFILNENFEAVTSGNYIYE